MIELTRLNGNRLVVNCDLIKYAEASPDTMLTLVTGEKLVVLETCDEVQQRVLAWRVLVLREVAAAAMAAADSAATATSATSANEALHLAKSVDK
jgi:flagellar protein FlbD